MRKQAFCIRKNKDANQLLATRIVQSFYFLNPNFQASSHLLCLYSPVCVGPGRKPRRLVFSQRGSYNSKSHSLCTKGKHFNIIFFRILSNSMMSFLKNFLTTLYMPYVNFLNNLYFTSEYCLTHDCLAM